MKAQIRRIWAFVVFGGATPRRADDLEDELARLVEEGVAITMPLTAEEWGERALQVRDPNGVVVQLVDWNGATAPR